MLIKSPQTDLIVPTIDFEKTERSDGRDQEIDFSCPKKSKKGGKHTRKPQRPTDRRSRGSEFVHSIFRYGPVRGDTVKNSGVRDRRHRNREIETLITNKIYTIGPKNQRELSSLSVVM